MNSKKPGVYPAKDLLVSKRGFTLVEVMTVLVIIAVLAMFAAPEVINWRPKMRLKGAADTLSENLQRAKIHAIKNNVNVIFTFTAGAGAPARTCTGGSYRFVDDSPGAVVVANVIMDDPGDQAASANLCIQSSTFAVGEGFTSRGLPIIAGGGAITLSNADNIKSKDPTFVATQSVAGGINLQRVLYP